MSKTTKCYGIIYYAPTHGRLVASACKMRGCERCGPGYWLPLKHAEFMSGMADTTAQYRFLTLTAPRISHSDGRLDWNRSGLQKAWNRLRASLGRKDKFEFWRVAELQQRGLLHYHVVTRGLTASSRRIKELAKRAGFGHVDVTQLPPERPQAMWRYLAKGALELSVPKRPRFAPFAKSRGWASGGCNPQKRIAVQDRERWFHVKPETTRLGTVLTVRVGALKISFEDSHRLLEELQTVGFTTTRTSDQEKIKHALALEPLTASIPGG